MNLASVSRGTFAINGADGRRDHPLKSEAVAEEEYSSTPHAEFYTIHFLIPVTIDTIICRLYHTHGRFYTFANFESSIDGNTWTEILAPGTVRSQTFKETFPPRLVSQIRMRARNNSNEYLLIIRFQAFFLQQEGEAAADVPVAMAVGGRESACEESAGGES